MRPLFVSGRRIAAAGLAIASLLLASIALAQEPREISTEGDWTAFETTENGRKVCYMVSQPIRSEGEYTQRGAIYAFVIHRPAEQTRNEFIFRTGYDYQSNASARVTIDGTDFTLTTDGDLAFTRNVDQESSLVTAIRRGTEMVVRGTSARGTATTDTFSLRGSSAAYDAITGACF